MRPADEHLTPQEFEQLLFETADSKGNANRASAQQAQQHLSGCAVCQSVAEKLNKIDSALRALGTNQGSSKPPTRGSECPADDAWVRLAAGVMAQEEMGPYVTHAAQCDWCGPLLKQAMEDLTQAVTAEEQDALQKLSSASPDWQREMAIKLAEASRKAASPASAGSAVLSDAREKPSKSTKRSAGFAWRPKLVWASAGLAIVTVAVWMGFRLTREPDVNQLLAQVYTEQRTIELRMPGAKYGPMRVERGGGKRDLPAQFYTAQGIIKTELAKHPEDAAWLQAQARAHLLEWSYEKAIQELDDALMLKPNDPGLRIDKATALYQRAKRDGSQASFYYGEAIDDLGKVLKLNPDDRVALFNRAILYQESSIPDKAIDDLHHYLLLDPTGAWADEARGRLHKLENLVKDHEQAVKEPLVDAPTFAALASVPTSAVELDRRIEDYQEIALKDWLSQAFSRNSNPEVRTRIWGGLQALGALLQARHDDRWLDEFLAAADDSPGSVAGINALGQAVLDGEKGNATEAYAEAERAARFFTATGNHAGKLRAEWEQIHALRNAQQGTRCLGKAKMLAAELANRSYSWIRAQFDVDSCSCYLMMGQFDLARAYASRALEDSKKGRFPVAFLRSIGIAASVETDEGQILSAWKQDQDGLSGYWQDRFSPARRAQQFYDDLTYAAENTNNLDLAVALAQESVLMSSLAGDRTLEAMTRQHLAGIAARNGKLSLATEQLQRSAILLEPLSAKPGMEAYRIYAQTGLAEIDLREGKIVQAEQRLNSIREEATQVDSFTVSRAFYKAYGELLEKQGRVDDAEQAFQRAIESADSHLSGLASSSSRYSWTQENSGLYRSLIQLELTKGDRQKALATWEWYRSALLGRTLVAAESLRSLWSTTELEKRMGNLKNQTVISYSILSEGLAIWTFDDRGMDVQLVKIDSGDLADLATYFFEMCSDPKSDLVRLQTRGRSLFDILLRPVANRLVAERTIIIEPDEVIGDLPFEALVADDGRYFGETYRVVYSPGLLYAHDVERPGSLSRDSRVLVVGSTANFAGPDSTLDPAFDVVQEAEDVAGLFPHANLLKEHRATVDAMESALPQAEAVHFAGHAISSARKEGLLMFKSANSRETDTEIWDAQRVNARLLKRAKLVVLSACSTGRTYRGRKEIHGELVRSLLLAGVPTAVGSRWNVNSSATGQFMERFYAALVSGQPVSSAMGATESAMRTGHETRHPYYWAAFAVFGGT